jgi:hypothetical protein
VPNLWPLEVLNALIVAEHRNRVTYDEAQEFLAVIHGLDVEVERTTSDQAFSNNFDDIHRVPLRQAAIQPLEANACERIMLVRQV